MEITCKGIDARRLQQCLSFIGPLDSLFPADASLNLDIKSNKFQLCNRPAETEIPHKIHSSYKREYRYASYRQAVIRMLAEHLAISRARALGTQPLGAITGNAILFQALRFHGHGYESHLQKIRQQAEFNHHKRADNRLDNGELDEATIIVSNHGLRMSLEEIRWGDLEINREDPMDLMGAAERRLSIKATLPQSIGASAVGRNLREVVSHPMLDPIDIEIIGYSDDKLFLRDKIITAAGGSIDYPEVGEAIRKYDEWEKTWDSGKDYPA